MADPVEKDPRAMAAPAEKDPRAAATLAATAAGGAPELPLDEAGARRLVRDSLFWGVRGEECELAGAVVEARPGVRLERGQRTVVAIGAFDGLHLGHRALVAAAAADARRRGVPCVAVTFDPDPAEVLGAPAPNERLLSCADRARGLLALGADAVVRFRFDAALAATGIEEFVRDRLCAIAAPVSVHVGTNFSFGRGGEGTPSSLAGFGRAYGFEVLPHDLVPSGGSPISATRVRGLLAAGSLEEANVLLGRCHFVRGVVEHGRGEGRAFGFPTANVVSDPLDALPREGVYACYLVSGASAWPAATNVGAPPTFSAPKPAFMEANLIGFSGNLYGRSVRVVFVRRLRDSRRFDSTDELRRVVLGNIEWVQRNLGGSGLEV